METQEREQGQATTSRRHFLRFAGAAAAALAFTGFGIRSALSLASVLLALGALLLAGRRRVELLLTVS